MNECHEEPSSFYTLSMEMMSRRPTAGRRLADSGSIPFVGALHSKSHTSPLLSIGLLVVGALLIIGYIYHGSGGRNGDIGSLNRLDGTQEVQRLIPILKKAYGDSMRKVLHVGPDTCSVVSQLLKEEDTEAWGVEPYELDEPDSNCKSLLRKGVMRVADIKFPLPYGPKSFSLVSLRCIGLLVAQVSQQDCSGACQGIC